MAYQAIIGKDFKKNCKILSMIDARNENVYFAVYRMKDGKISIYKNPDVLNITEIIEYLNFNEPLLITGDVTLEKLEPFIMAKKSKEMAEGKDTEEHIYIKNQDDITRAEAIGIAGFDKYNQEFFGNSETISPMYLRKPQAERQKDISADSKLYMLSMSQTDLENLSLNYEQFPNIWDYKTLKEDYLNSNYIVAKQNEEIVGFIATRTVLDEMEIMNIVTRKDKRESGIASNLLSFIIRNNEVEKINLEVNEHNNKAMNLYKKFGFAKVGLRKKYYNNTENAILMTL